MTEPCVVMRNMRQVMNGLKNYTGEFRQYFPQKILRKKNSTIIFYFQKNCAPAVNSGEGEVARLIQKERECLRPDQFFDIDMVSF